MTSETRTHLRTVLMWLAVALGIVAVAVTYVPALSGWETYRVGFMAFALSAVLAFQALAPRQGRVSH